MKLKVKKIDENAKLPERKREGDAGLDLYCLESFEIKPNEIKVVRTGIAVEIPKGYFGLIKDRSGLATKGLHVLAGVIDENYRGEVQVVLINFGKETISFEKHSRIAQLIIIPYLKVEIEETKELSESLRGTSGFGSTGLK
ncbi:MAG: dUTP diphosphatase [Candidatus Aenigmatarchaeota archaeon]